MPVHLPVFDAEVSWPAQHLKRAVDDELPLVERGVPVHLPHAAGAELDQRAHHGGGHGEVGLVGNVDVAARGVNLRAQASSGETACRRTAGARQMVSAERVHAD